MKHNNQPVIEPGPYSIQWVYSNPGRCVVCHLLPVGSGLIGFKHIDPAGPPCDPCIMQLQPRLVTLLLLANICRELADGYPDKRRDRDRRQTLLIAVARVYHAQESKLWPVRKLTLLDFWEQFGGNDLPSSSLERWIDSLWGNP